MRKLATVLLLLVLCVGSASAQWNLAQDPAASLNTKTLAHYEVQSTSTGYNVLLKEREGSIDDEVFIWRTGTGATAYTVSDINAYDATLLTLPKEVSAEAQCKAAILKGIAIGKQVRPASNLAQTKVWFLLDGKALSMNFEIKWNSAGGTVITRLPDDVVSSTVQ